MKLYEKLGNFSIDQFKILKSNLPKSTFCFFNIPEKKITGVETTPLTSTWTTGITGITGNNWEE